MHSFFCSLNTPSTMFISASRRGLIAASASYSALASRQVARTTAVAIRCLHAHPNPPTDPQQALDYLRKYSSSNLASSLTSLPLSPAPPFPFPSFTQVRVTADSSLVRSNRSTLLGTWTVSRILLLDKSPSLLSYLVLILVSPLKSSLTKGKP